MTMLWDKLCILVLCSLSFISTSISVGDVVVVLCAVACSAFAQSFSDKRICAAAELVYTSLCFISPSFVLMLPIIVYDIFRDRTYYFLGISIIAVIVKPDRPEMKVLLLTLAVSAAAVLLENKTERLDNMKHKLIEMRDNSTELNNLLVEKNKYLLDSQDYEIHVATLKERNRIAREIHDTVGHVITRMILQMGAVLVINKDENMKAPLTSIKSGLDSAMNSIRQSVHDLHDDSVDLRLSVEEAVMQIKNDYEIIEDFDFSDNIPSKVKYCFIGIIKESLSNVIRHSNATRVKITIREHPGFYQLLVEDNGVNKDEIKKTGIGLTNMEDRARSAGGIFRIQSDESGFKIFVSVAKELRESK